MMTRMQPHFFVIPLVVLTLNGCAREAPATTSPEIFSPALASAYRSYDRTMAEPRTPLEFASGRTVRNCGEYLEERARGETSETVYNRTVEGEYRFCDAVDLLRRAGPVQTARHPPSFYAREIVERLDLGSFLSSLRPMMEHGAHQAMSSLDGLSPRTDGFTVISDTDDWYYSFEVVARGDFGKDGSEDWLVLFTDRAKEGNYRGSSVLVVEDVTGPGLLRVGLQR